MTAEWHRPTYGPPHLRKPYGQQQQQPEPLLSQQALVYPYGNRFTCDIPSWASTPEQVSTALPFWLQPCLSLISCRCPCRLHWTCPGLWS